MGSITLMLIEVVVHHGLCVVVAIYTGQGTEAAMHEAIDIHKAHSKEPPYSLDVMIERRQVTEHKIK